MAFSLWAGGGFRPQGSGDAIPCRGGALSAGRDAGGEAASAALKYAPRGGPCKELKRETLETRAVARPSCSKLIT